MKGLGGVGAVMLGAMLVLTIKIGPATPRPERGRTPTSTSGVRAAAVPVAVSPAVAERPAREPDARLCLRIAIVRDRL